MPTKPEPPTPKRTKPTPSPEFAQARLRRDIRLLDERREKLRRVHEDKMAEIATEREKLVYDLEAVNKRLEKSVPSETTGGGG